MAAAENETSWTIPQGKYQWCFSPTTDWLYDLTNQLERLESQKFSSAYWFSHLKQQLRHYKNHSERPTGLLLLCEEHEKELRKIADQVRVQRVSQNPLSHTSPVTTSPFFSFFSTFQALNRAWRVNSLFRARFTLYCAVQYPSKQQYETSTGCFQGPLPGKRLISGRQMERCLSV